jgi:hypothetical protein
VKRLAELAPTEPASDPLFPGFPVVRPCSCHRNQPKAVASEW